MLQRRLQKSFIFQYSALMNEPTSKKTDRFLQGNHELNSLLTKVKHLEELSKRIVPYLEEGMKPYCRVANLQNGKLTMVVANSSIATQFRFQTVDLVRKFRSDPVLASIQTIQCKVHPYLAKAQLPQSSIVREKMKPLSKGTAEMIQAAAEGLEDKKLQEVMMRIAKRVK